MAELGVRFFEVLMFECPVAGKDSCLRAVSCSMKTKLMPLSVILVWHLLYSWRVSYNPWKLLTWNRIWRIFLRSCYLLKKLLTFNIDTLTDSLSLAMPKEGSVTIISNCLDWLTCEPKEQKCFTSNWCYRIFNRCAFWVAEGTAWPTFILIAEGVFCDLMLAEFSCYISDVKVDHLSMVCLFFSWWVLGVRRVVAVQYKGFSPLLSGLFSSVLGYWRVAALTDCCGSKWQADSCDRWSVSHCSSSCELE